MSTKHVYSRCPVCRHNNVHVHGNRLTEHYDGNTRCPGSGILAPEKRGPLPPETVKKNPPAATYTTTKGNILPLTPKLWKGIKRAAASRFDGSGALFESCWRTYRGYLKGAIDDPGNIDDVMRWLDQIASEKVNDPGSKFYIYG